MCKINTPYFIDYRRIANTLTVGTRTNNVARIYRRLIPAHTRISLWASNVLYIVTVV